MALLQKLKEKLGIGTGPADRGSDETEVTIEREAAESADGSAVEDGEAEGDGEPGGDAEAPSDEGGVDEAADDAGEDDSAATDGDPTDGDGTTVEEIKGIGPAYAERLAEVDIETVDQLAAADAADIAAGASISEKRATRWIDRANEF